MRDARVMRPITPIGVASRSGRSRPQAATISSTWSCSMGESLASSSTTYYSSSMTSYFSAPIGLQTAGAPAAWGTTYWITTELLPPDRPLLAAAGRALPAGAALTVAMRRLPPGGWAVRLVVLATLNVGLFFPLLFVGAERLPGGVAATAGALAPIIVLLLGWPLLGIRP